MGPSEIDEFLNSTAFSGYQAVPLPGGRQVPGRDRTAAADIALAGGVAGKSVLDVGTYYGFLPYVAARKGARRAVGLEPDGARFSIAEQIARFNGGYEVLNTPVEEFGSSERFDLVCLLNVLHHVNDPIQVLRKLAALCSETLVVEFCLPDDPDYIQHVVAGTAKARAGAKIRAKLQSVLLRSVSRGLPLMAVGNRPYHRVFYFSPSAFVNLMVVHLALATDIQFVASPYGSHRMLAICTVTRPDQ